MPIIQALKAEAGEMNSRLHAYKESILQTEIHPTQKRLNGVVTLSNRKSPRVL